MTDMQTTLDFLFRLTELVRHMNENTEDGKALRADIRAGLHRLRDDIGWYNTKESNE